MKSTQPIGIFDSGIGGLTVARAVKKYLPNEQLIYFGDIAHLPYGDKSAAAIQAYSVRITQLLLKKKCKVILVACNSASSAAYDLVTEYVGAQCKVFDVINPTIDFIRENHPNERVGLIGTKQTIASDVYGKKIQSIDKHIEFTSLATPLLVPMIEEGIVANQITRDIVANYLSHASLQEINALILGCTHYPVIKQEIANYYNEKGQQVTIIDSAETVAKSLQAFLAFNQLVARDGLPKDEFLVSDYTDAFAHMTRTFFGEEVSLRQVNILEEIG